MTLRARRRTEFSRHRRSPCAPFNQQDGLDHQAVARRTSIEAALQVGKYLISPLARREAGGRYLASVSIRSGRGSMTHDRVMRFVPLFDSHAEATRFAIGQALAWLGARAPSADPSTPTPELPAWPRKN